MFSGSLVALVTPLKDNNLDIPALGKLIDWQVDSGTDGIVVCGSTGEGLLLTDEERTKVISVAIEVANKRVPIIVGCSACATTEALRLVHIAEDLRADGALVVAPYYLKPTQAGIIEHFSCVRKNSNLPVIMYNNPGRCAVNMSIDTIVNLAKLGGMALKDSDPNLARVTV
ncbi:MAG: dihydrodipicolinate synthase family protein, partial [Holosporales bacterium]|nr:dihydrodipicolinate synthase family protein [Holosporales bacterium]